MVTSYSIIEKDQTKTPKKNGKKKKKKRLRKSRHRRSGIEKAKCLYQKLTWQAC
jgi:hypothetical protein